MDDIYSQINSSKSQHILQNKINKYMYNLSISGMINFLCLKTKRQYTTVFFVSPRKNIFSQEETLSIFTPFSFKDKKIVNDILTQKVTRKIKNKYLYCYPFLVSI
jgi:hypothetical protein